MYIPKDPFWIPPLVVGYIVCTTMFGAKMHAQSATFTSSRLSRLGVSVAQPFKVLSSLFFFASVSSWEDWHCKMLTWKLEKKKCRHLFYIHRTLQSSRPKNERFFSLSNRVSFVWKRGNLRTKSEWLFSSFFFFCYLTLSSFSLPRKIFKKILMAVYQQKPICPSSSRGCSLLDISG